MSRSDFLSNKFIRTKSLEIKRPSSFTGKPINMSMPDNEDNMRPPSVASSWSMMKQDNMSMPETENYTRPPSVVSCASIGKPINNTMPDIEDNMSTVSGQVSLSADSGVESMEIGVTFNTPFNIHQQVQQKSRHAVPGDAACDLCGENKLKACKSCMTCLASFCEIHVRDHYTKEPLNRHLLVEVTKNLDILQDNQKLKNTITKECGENKRLRDENQALKKDIETLKQRICKLRLPDYICKGRVPVPADLTLDPETAHCALLLSNNGKQVRVGDKTTVHQSAQRFDKWECVLAREGFSSGRHYWEVEVNREFTIGVTQQSAQRKGKFIFCPSEGYWCLYHFRQAFTALDDPVHRLQVDSVPRVLGVCIDVDEKWVAFYNTETKAHIYTFRNMAFTDGEKIYPVFNTMEKSANLEIKTEKIFTA